MSISSWLGRRRLDDEDFQEEITAHLAIAADERMADGADQRTAQRASLKDFGNLAHTTEAVRQVWTPRWLDTVHDYVRDVRYAVRALVRQPVFSLTVIVILTTGIALNAAVFTLLKSLALSPIAGVDRSSSLGVVLNEMSGGRRAGLSFPDYRYLREHDRAFAGLFGSAVSNLNLGSGLRAERLMGEFVTGNYFQELGVRAQIGRTLSPSDEIAPSQHPVVVLSDTLWRRRFGASPDVLGTTIHLNTYPLTVVGVAEPAFHGTIVSFDVEAFIPIMMAPEFELGITADPKTVLTDRRAGLVAAMGRLRPGSTLADAAAEMAVLRKQLDVDAPIDAPAREVKVLPIWRSPFGAQTYMLPAVTVLSAMGALLLLTVCANLAGLVLARGLSRRGEIAVRLALGAGRTRILRLLLIENLVLAIPAGVAAVVLVPQAMPAVLGGMASVAPMRLFLNLSVDRLVIGFAVLAAMVSAVAFGLLPAMQSARTDLLTVMKQDLSPRGAAKGRFRTGLVIAQVAISLLLLIGGALVTRSLAAARHADVGFDPANIISARVDLRPNGYDDVRGRAFFAQLLDRLRADRGIESAGLALMVPLSLVPDGARTVTIDGYQAKTGEDLAFLSNIVGADYFRTLRIALLAGRDFAEADDATAPAVVIVNETLARRYWNSPTGAIGQRIQASSHVWRTVVGVVHDVKYSTINEAPQPYVYLPFLQNYRPMMLIHARGGSGIAALAERMQTEIQALDPELPILGLRTLAEQTRSGLLFLELAAGMLFIFGAAGMALSAIGVYGLVSYTVRQSTQEIGIRMALGAQGFGVVWAFLGRGLRLGAIGAVLGTITALAVTRLLTSVLYGVSATDATSFIGSLAIVLGGVSLATIIPAWRAARTNPITALRHQ